MAAHSDPRRVELARLIAPERRPIHRSRARPRRVEATPRPAAPPRAEAEGPRLIRPATVVGSAVEVAHRTGAVEAAVVEAAECTSRVQLALMQ